MVATVYDRDVQIAVEDVTLVGRLTVPVDAYGVIAFAHGSGSSRFSPRNGAVASALVRAGLAALLMDLLTAEEEVEDERTTRLRFDIPLLARRVGAVVSWLAASQLTSDQRIGLFGASTGAAAALIAAAESPDSVAAVVSRGGRPDLAGGALAAVRAPTLLIVGGADTAVLELNRAALAQLRGEKRLAIVPDATHLFEEPGALGQVADLAVAWFMQYLGGAASARL